MSTILAVEHITHFDPRELLGPDFLIWRGPPDGDGLVGEEEQDPRSLVLTEINPGLIQLVTALESGEDIVQGEEILTRLRASGNILLDIQILQTLLRDQECIPKSWKGKTVFFPGTILRNSSGCLGRRHVVYLYWNGHGWFLMDRQIDGNFGVDHSFAILPSPSADPAS